MQIRLYDNCFSIWNEGFLPKGLSLEALKRQHPPRSRNPVIADVCFKGGYIDSWVRGTLKIINVAREAGLPEPEMMEQDGGMLVTLFKDNFTEEQLRKAGLNERQIKAVKYVLMNKSITNSEYQLLNEIGKSVAAEELRQLVEKDLLMLAGKGGRGSKYILRE